MELIAKVKVFIRLKECEDQLRAINEDLNEQVKVRSMQLIEAEKLTALGQHTAGIVHNLNNPLQALMGHAELLKMDYPDDENINRLIGAAKSIKDMIRTILLRTGRERNPHTVEIDFNRIITDLLELMKLNPYFENNIVKRLNLQTLPVYKGVYSHFSQSLGNLIKNAADAMYDSEVRVLEISTSCEHEMIHINISDTGCGIREEDKERIFDPFFTTKQLLPSNGRPTGTGLGLASARDMIESYKGKITVVSIPGKGTSFKISLPVGEHV